jgi:hypothetical protein
MQMQAGRSPQSFHGVLAVASARAVHANPNRSVRHTSPKFRCAKTRCTSETSAADRRADADPAI